MIRRSTSTRRVISTRAAIEGYNAVLEAEPGHYRAKTMRASLMIQSGFSADGVKELAQCIKENPDDYVAYNNIALGLFHLEKYDLALRQLDRALELKPNHPEALALAAKIKKHLGTETRPISLGRCSGQPH